ncbi:MAG: hypothetical protein ACHQF3_11695, partial [Alphaproteobacteria bacterium]
MPKIGEKKASDQARRLDQRSRNEREARPPSGRLTAAMAILRGALATFRTLPRAMREQFAVRADSEHEQGLI